METAVKSTGLTRVLRVAIPTAVLVAIVLAWIVPRHARRSATEAMLTQIGVALRMYAAEHSDRYPPKSASPQEFHPDMAVFEEYFSDSPEGRTLVSYLTGEGEYPVCYLGHMVFDDEMALYLLDQYTTGDPYQVREADIRLERDARERNIRRLREGAERWRIYTIGDASAGLEAAATIPILWEVPPPGGRHRALVLYMDGHVESKRYPGMFPMTQACAMRVRRMMGLAPDAETEETGTAIRTEAASPVAPIAETVLDVAAKWAPPPERWTITHCDTRPSVAVDGHRGYRIAVDVKERQYGGEDRLLSPGDLAGLARMPDKRLLTIPRTSPTVTETFEIVLLQSAPGILPSFKESIRWRNENQGMHVVVDMGQGMGYGWFGNMPVLRQEFLRRHLDLTGGDDRYKLFAQHERWFTDSLWMRAGLRELSELPDGEKTAALTRLCDSPADFYEYRGAFEAKRALGMRPIPDELRDAECVFRALWHGLDYYDTPPDVGEKAREVLVDSTDHQAVALVALDLALAKRGKVCYLDERRQAGRDLLLELPRSVTTPILEHLAAHLGDAEQETLATELLEELPHQDDRT